MDQQLGDTLRAILSDPDSMKSILKIAQNLGAQNADASSENAQPHENGSADSEEGASTTRKARQKPCFRSGKSLRQQETTARTTA